MTADPIERAARALRATHEASITQPTTWQDAARAVFASIDRDDLARMIHDANDEGRERWLRDGTFRQNRFEYLADAILAWLTGGEPRD